MTRKTDAPRQVRVLIVDDDANNRRLLELMLAPQGFILSSASGGLEALDIVARQPPDLILLDVMARDVDGVQVAARLERDADTAGIPLIMVTSLGEREWRQQRLDVGADALRSKPVDRAELRARLRDLSRLESVSDAQRARSIDDEVALRTSELTIRTRSLEQQAVVLIGQAALLDLAQDPIIVRGMDDRIHFWSRGAERVYGWRSDEVHNRSLFEVLDMQLDDPHHEAHATLLRQGWWEGEATCATRGGTRMTIASRWALERDADGAPGRILSINNDITARKRSDLQLLSLTRRLSLATAVAQVGVWELNLATDTLTWDATMFSIYGMEPRVPMPYESWKQTVLPEDFVRVQASQRTAATSKGQGACEYRILRPDGATRIIASIEGAVLDEHGHVSQLIGVNRDVTEEREAAHTMEASVHAQLRFKDEFLSHVSHELRSPLTAVKQFTSILLSECDGAVNADQREYLEIVLRNIAQLQAMIDDLLEVTRLETGKLTIEPESVAVRRGVSDSLHTLHAAAQAKGVTLSHDIAEYVPDVFADPTRFRQVLINLLDNAIKFTPRGGEVVVRARLEQEADEVVFEVVDSGCGIDPALTERLFDRLFQVQESHDASRKGIGLGLYISRELVARQGGRIWATRGAERGSTFSFSLPIFSLDRSLAPLLKQDNWPAESVAIVVVETTSPTPWTSSEAQETWTAEARTIVQRCLLPTLDVLLPTRFRATLAHDLHILVFADETGTIALANRIRAEFEGHPRRRESNLTVSVTHALVPPPRSQPDDSLARKISRMASHLDAFSRTLSRPTVPSDDRPQDPRD